MSSKSPYTTKNALYKKLENVGILTPQVSLALKRAHQVHKNQTRDKGTPYLEEHIYPVALSILNRYKDHKDLETMLIVAILHDSIEDDDVYSVELCKKEFGEKIAKYVNCLTKEDKPYRHRLTEQQKYNYNKQYLQELKKCDLVVKIVKLEERLNNLMCTLVVGDSPKYKRYARGTRDFFLPMAASVSPEYVDLYQKEIDRLMATQNS